MWMRFKSAVSSWRPSACASSSRIPELVGELLPAARVLAVKADAGRVDAVGLGEAGHALRLERGGGRGRVLLEALALGRVGGGAVAAAAQHQRQRAVGIGQAEMQRGVASHGDADDMRLVEAERVEHGADIVARARLRIALQPRRHVRGRVSPRVVGDGAVAPREIAQLRLVAAVIAGEFMDADDCGAGARLFVVEPDAVVGGEMWHGMLPLRACGDWRVPHRW